ncbi:MAG: NlpC/P60 family protein [Eubacteriales bacterium]|nr:NlpC/P60 family protein [Eubacteriales bacterium]
MKIIRTILTLTLALVLAAGCIPLTASAASNMMYGIGFVTANSLRLRSSAATTASTLDTAVRGECVAVIAKEGDWYKVNYNLQEGYMHADYLSVSTKENAELGYGNILGTGVNLRTGPSTSYPVAAVSSQDDQCYIIGINQGWYKVLYNNKTCYIRSDFVELTEIPYENPDSPNSPKYFRGGKSIGTASSASAAPVTVTGSQILAEAQKYLGCPYKAGGASPSGFDCSGFVYYVLKQLGLSPYRTPSDQYKMGTKVEKSALQVGDLVFFGSGSITHAGIYAGGGQFIHAPNSRSTVSYSDFTSGYWAQNYYGACRVAQ